MNRHCFHIVAASGNAVKGEGVIGRNNQLPWPKNPADLKFFKETTMNGTLIMGRKTFESLGRRPLPGRENIVLSASPLDVSAEVKVCHSLEDALTVASKENVFIIGGAEVYRQTMDKIEGIYLTQIGGSYLGDTKYPSIPSIFEENKEISQRLQEKFKIPVVYLENTTGSMTNLHQ